MPSFSDSIVLFILALLLFGPKKLPVLARELGKWIGEFRRASNEFKSQMEEELRLSEQAERTRQIAAMEAAAPPPPPIPEPEHPHTPLEIEATSTPEPEIPAAPASIYEIVDGVRTPVLPIATAGEVSIMPPSTGLPKPRNSALSGLIQSIPEAKSEAQTEPHPETPATAPETAAHGN